MTMAPFNDSSGGDSLILFRVLSDHICCTISQGTGGSCCGKPRVATVRPKVQFDFSPKQDLQPVSKSHLATGPGVHHPIDPVRQSQGSMFYQIR